MAVLIDMKIAKVSKKSTTEAPISMDRDEYPYGLRITLNSDQIKKLPGIMELDVGGSVRIMATGTLTEKSTEKVQGSADRNRISIQLEKVAFESMTKKDKGDVVEFMREERGFKKKA